MERSTTLRKNPSRETCEGIIKRILMTEVLENGSNKHFRFASDFMNYFESLVKKLNEKKFSFEGEDEDEELKRLYAYTQKIKNEKKEG